MENVYAGSVCATQVGVVNRVHVPLTVAPAKVKMG